MIRCALLGHRWAEKPGEMLSMLEDERAYWKVRERSIQGQVAAHVSWANTLDREARTRSARDAFEARFERQVDPDGTMDPKERAKRAAHARKAYLLGLSLKSAKARRQKAAQRAARPTPTGDGQ